MSDTLTLAQITDLLSNLPPSVTVEIARNDAGTFTVSQNHNQTKEEIIAARFAALRGVGITISDAAEKYGVTRRTIENWVYRTGDVCFVDETSYPKLVDEAEVAVCAEIYHERQKTGLTGVPYFNEEGRLIEEIKHPHRSRRK